ncbi:MAG: polymorphic outer membrane protein [Microgenomates group bacterium Gr01-1014_16]|nr:MAG: polymorphic outer membrane protein [Microgenomates group bacterium Gr01-1014_16]
MKKEVFLAIAIGFGLGLVITFGIWTANKSLKDAQLAQQTTPTATPAPTVVPSESRDEVGPTPSFPVTVTLTVTSPEDESLVNKDTVTITGKTAPGATVTILSEIGEVIVAPDNSGNFTADIKLEGGYNNITITAFDSTGNSNSQTLTITYTTAKV